MSGLGRVYSEDGLIFDGNFEKGHLNGLGYLYNSETNLFYEGLFYENECNKLFKKSKGFQQETITNHRATQHRQAFTFSDQLLVLEIAQIVQGQTSLINLYKNNQSMMDDDMESLIQNDNNPLFIFIQRNKEYMETKRNNCFYYPNQIMNRQLFNTSSLSSHQGLQATSYPYEEYEFSLHEFQRQLERPTMNATITSENYQINERQTNYQNNNLSNQNSVVVNNTSNIYSRQRNNASPGLQKNMNSALSTNQMNTRMSSPQVKTFDSFVSTPKQQKYNEPSAIERKLTFSNAMVSSNHNSNSQLQSKNPYFQMIPSSSQENNNQESLRNSYTKQNQTSTSFIDNTNNYSQRSSNPYNNNKTAKKQGNWLYEQIRGRSNTPNLTNRYMNNSNNNNYNNTSVNNHYNNNNLETVVEREKANPHNNAHNQMNQNQTYNIQQNKQAQLRSSHSNNSYKTQQYASLQNPFKNQINMTQNSSNYSTSQINISEVRNSSNSQLPKSKIFNRPKSSMNQLSREPAQPSRFQTTNDSINRRSISPISSQTQSRQSNFKQPSPLRTQQNSNKNISPVSNRVFKNSNNSLKKSESPIPKFRVSKQQSPLISKNLVKQGVKKQKENIKQVHLRLPSSFFN